MYKTNLSILSTLASKTSKPPHFPRALTKLRATSYTITNFSRGLVQMTYSMQRTV